MWQITKLQANLQHQYFTTEILHRSAILPCFERFSSTLISVGSFFTFGSSSTFGLT